MLYPSANFTPQNSPYQGLPNFGGFGVGMPFAGGYDMGTIMMRGLLSQTMTLMMGLMAQMTSQGIGLPGMANFGNSTMGSLSSPLGGFLGGGNATNGSAARGGTSSNFLKNYVSKNNGKHIPGGKSLYKGKGMFHKGAPGAPNTYAFENSPAGIKFAAEHGYSSIDIDMQITKDGVPVATHWSKPLKKDGFYDPLGKIGKKTKVSEMTLAEVMRLRNKDGQSRIYPVSSMVNTLKKYGMAASFEAKDDRRFGTDEVMGYLADLVAKSGIKANLHSIDRGPRVVKILKAAQAHGFWARLVRVKNGHRKNWGYA